MTDDPSKNVPPTGPGDQPPPPGYGQPYPPNFGGAYPPPPPPPGQHPGQYPPPGYGQAYPQYGQAGPQKHPQAVTSMVLGIVALAGMFTCFFPILAAPFAWALGSKAVKQIDANPGAYSGRSEAMAGKVMGIIGTILLVLGVIAIIGFIVLLASSSGFRDSFDEEYSTYLIGRALIGRVF